MAAGNLSYLINIDLLKKTDSGRGRATGPTVLESIAAPYRQFLAPDVRQVVLVFLPKSTSESEAKSPKCFSISRDFLEFRSIKNLKLDVIRYYLDSGLITLNGVDAPRIKGMKMLEIWLRYVAKKISENDYRALYEPA
ncbi:hypothetical protein EBR57_08860 [bacterium]|nr:hypothetical protein [bacterium]